jgi:hypothetical protein
LHGEGLGVNVAACGTTYMVMGDRTDSVLVINTYGSAYEVMVSDFWVFGIVGAGVLRLYNIEGERGIF